MSTELRPGGHIISRRWGTRRLFDPTLPFSTTTTTTSTISTGKNHQKPPTRLLPSWISSQSQHHESQYLFKPRLISISMIIIIMMLFTLINLPIIAFATKDIPIDQGLGDLQLVDLLVTSPITTMCPKHHTGPLCQFKIISTIPLEPPRDWSTRHYKDLTYPSMPFHFYLVPLPGQNLALNDLNLYFSATKGNYDTQLVSVIPTDDVTKKVYNLPTATMISSNFPTSSSIATQSVIDSVIVRYIEVTVNVIDSTKMQAYQWSFAFPIWLVAPDFFDLAQYPHPTSCKPTSLPMSYHKPPVLTQSIAYQTRICQCDQSVLMLPAPLCTARHQSLLMSVDNNYLISTPDPTPIIINMNFFYSLDMSQPDDINALWGSLQLNEIKSDQFRFIFIDRKKMPNSFYIIPIAYGSLPHSTNLGFSFHTTLKASNGINNPLLEGRYLPANLAPDHPLTSFSINTDPILFPIYYEFVPFHGSIYSNLGQSIHPPMIFPRDDMNSTGISGRTWHLYSIRLDNPFYNVQLTNYWVLSQSIVTCELNEVTLDILSSKRHSWTHKKPQIKIVKNFQNEYVLDYYLVSPHPSIDNDVLYGDMMFPSSFTIKYSCPPQIALAYKHLPASVYYYSIVPSRTFDLQIQNYSFQMNQFTAHTPRSPTLSQPSYSFNYLQGLITTVTYTPPDNLGDEFFIFDSNVLIHHPSVFKMRLHDQVNHIEDEIVWDDDTNVSFMTKSRLYNYYQNGHQLLGIPCYSVSTPNKIVGHFNPFNFNLNSNHNVAFGDMSISNTDTDNTLYYDVLQPDLTTLSRQKSLKIHSILGTIYATESCTYSLESHITLDSIQFNDDQWDTFNPHGVLSQFNGVYGSSSYTLPTFSRSFSPITLQQLQSQQPQPVSLQTQFSSIAQRVTAIANTLTDIMGSGRPLITIHPFSPQEQSPSSSSSRPNLDQPKIYNNINNGLVIEVWNAPQKNDLEKIIMCYWGRDEGNDSVKMDLLQDYFPTFPQTTQYSTKYDQFSTRTFNFYPSNHPSERFDRWDLYGVKNEPVEHFSSFTNFIQSSHRCLHLKTIIPLPSDFIQSDHAWRARIALPQPIDQFNTGIPTISFHLLPDLISTIPYPPPTMVNNILTWGLEPLEIQVMGSRGELVQFPLTKAMLAPSTTSSSVTPPHSSIYKPHPHIPLNSRQNNDLHTTTTTTYPTHLSIDYPIDNYFERGFVDFNQPLDNDTNNDKQWPYKLQGEADLRFDRVQIETAQGNNLNLAQESYNQCIVYELTLDIHKPSTWPTMVISNGDFSTPFDTFIIKNGIRIALINDDQVPTLQSKGSSQKTLLINTQTNLPYFSNDFIEKYAVYTQALHSYPSTTTNDVNKNYYDETLDHLTSLQFTTSERITIPLYQIANGNSGYSKEILINDLVPVNGVKPIKKYKLLVSIPLKSTLISKSILLNSIKIFIQPHWVINTLRQPLSFYRPLDRDVNNQNLIWDLPTEVTPLPQVETQKDNVWTWVVGGGFLFDDYNNQDWTINPDLFRFTPSKRPIQTTLQSNNEIIRDLGTLPLDLLKKIQVSFRQFFRSLVDLDQDGLTDPQFINNQYSLSFHQTNEVHQWGSGEGNSFFRMESLILPSSSTTTPDSNGYSRIGKPLAGNSNPKNFLNKAHVDFMLDSNPIRGQFPLFNITFTSDLPSTTDISSITLYLKTIFPYVNHDNVQIITNININRDHSTVGTMMNSKKPNQCWEDGLNAILHPNLICNSICSPIDCNVIYNQLPTPSNPHPVDGCDVMRGYDDTQHQCVYEHTMQCIIFNHISSAYQHMPINPTPPNSIDTMLQSNQFECRCLPEYFGRYCEMSFDSTTPYLRDHFTPNDHKWEMQVKLHPSKVQNEIFWFKYTLGHSTDVQQNQHCLDLGEIVSFVGPQSTRLSYYGRIINYSDDNNQNLTPCTCNLITVLSYTLTPIVSFPIVYIPPKPVKHTFSRPLTLIPNNYDYYKTINPTMCHWPGTLSIHMDWMDSSIPSRSPCNCIATTSNSFFGLRCQWSLEMLTLSNHDDDPIYLYGTDNGVFEISFPQLQATILEINNQTPNTFPLNFPSLALNAIFTIRPSIDSSVQFIPVDYTLDGVIKYKAPDNFALNPIMTDLVIHIPSDPSQDSITPTISYPFLLQQGRGVVVASHPCVICVIGNTAKCQPHFFFTTRPLNSSPACECRIGFYGPRCQWTLSLETRVTKDALLQIVAVINPNRVDGNNQAELSDDILEYATDSDGKLLLPTKQRVKTIHILYNNTPLVTDVTKLITTNTVTASIPYDMTEEALQMNSFIPTDGMISTIQFQLIFSYNAKVVYQLPFITLPVSPKFAVAGIDTVNRTVKLRWYRPKRPGWIPGGDPNDQTLYPKQPSYYWSFQLYDISTSITPNSPPIPSLDLLAATVSVNAIKYHDVYHVPESIKGEIVLRIPPREAMTAFQILCILDNPPAIRTPETNNQITSSFDSIPSLCQPNPCSSKGICDIYTGLCKCVGNYHGDQCTLPGPSPRNFINDFIRYSCPGLMEYSGMSPQCVCKTQQCAKYTRGFTFFLKTRNNNGDQSFYSAQGIDFFQSFILTSNLQSSLYLNSLPYRTATESLLGSEMGGVEPIGIEKLELMPHYSPRFHITSFIITMTPFSSLDPTSPINSMTKIVPLREPTEDEVQRRFSAILKRYQTLLDAHITDQDVGLQSIIKSLPLDNLLYGYHMNQPYSNPLMGTQGAQQAFIQSSIPHKVKFTNFEWEEGKNEKSTMMCKHNTKAIWSPCNYDPTSSHWSLCGRSGTVSKVIDTNNNNNDNNDNISFQHSQNIESLPLQSSTIFGPSYTARTLGQGCLDYHGNLWTIGESNGWCTILAPRSSPVLTLPNSCPQEAIGDTTSNPSTPTSITSSNDGVVVVKPNGYSTPLHTVKGGDHINAPMSLQINPFYTLSVYLLGSGLFELPQDNYPVMNWISDDDNLSYGTSGGGGGGSGSTGSNGIKNSLFQSPRSISAFALTSNTQKTPPQNYFINKSSNSKNPKPGPIYLGNLSPLLSLGNIILPVNVLPTSNADLLLVPNQEARASHHYSNLNPSQSFSILPLDLCRKGVGDEEVKCKSPLAHKCNPYTGLCECRRPFKPSGLRLSDTDPGGCILWCSSLCLNDGLCTKRTIYNPISKQEEEAASCQCPSGFSGDFCQINNSCHLESEGRCNQHGFVRTTFSKMSKLSVPSCSSECQCVDNWYTPNTNPPLGSTEQCLGCRLVDFFCDQIGTDMTKTGLKCNECICKQGYGGKDCSYFTLMGSITYQSMLVGPIQPVLVYHNQKEPREPNQFQELATDNNQGLLTSWYTSLASYLFSTQLSTSPDVTKVSAFDIFSEEMKLDIQTIGQLEIDLAVSLRINPNDVSVARVIKSIPLDSGQSGVVDVTITFNMVTLTRTNGEIDLRGAGASFNDMHNAWMFIYYNLPNLSIGKSEATKVIGSPTGATKPYSPHCNTNMMIDQCSSNRINPMLPIVNVVTPTDPSTPEEPSLPIENDDDDDILVPILISVGAIFGVFIMIVAWIVVWARVFSNKEDQQSQMSFVPGVELIEGNNYLYPIKNVNKQSHFIIKRHNHHHHHHHHHLHHHSNSPNTTHGVFDYEDSNEADDDFVDGDDEHHNLDDYTNDVLLTDGGNVHSRPQVSSDGSHKSNRTGSRHLVHHDMNKPTQPLPDHLINHISSVSKPDSAFSSRRQSIGNVSNDNNTLPHSNNNKINDINNNHYLNNRSHSNTNINTHKKAPNSHNGSALSVSNNNPRNHSINIHNTNIIPIALEIGPILSPPHSSTTSNHLRGRERGNSAHSIRNIPLDTPRKPHYRFGFDSPSNAPSRIPSHNRQSSQAIPIGIAASSSNSTQGNLPNVINIKTNVDGDTSTYDTQVNSTRLNNNKNQPDSTSNQNTLSIELRSNPNVNTHINTSLNRNNNTTTTTTTTTNNNQTHSNNTPHNHHHVPAITINNTPMYRSGTSSITHHASSHIKIHMGTTRDVSPLPQTTNLNNTVRRASF